MRLLLFFAALILVSGAGCTKSSTAEPNRSDQTSGRASVSSAAEMAESPSKAAAASTEATVVDKASSPGAEPTSPYRIMGVLDPERDRMVAFALKVPSGWRTQQEFHRTWQGAVGLPQIAITLDAPDGRS